tara:strand:+ start:4435 stop:4614 length:180 start_codon:yes stop_codon:yes gene_type:complete
MKGYKKGTLLQEYFLNPHFDPTEKEEKQLAKDLFEVTGGKVIYHGKDELVSIKIVEKNA